VTKVCSGLVGIGLLFAVTAAAGQQPVEKAPQPKPKSVEPQKPAADNLEAVIAAAVRNHPDIKLAQAKMQVAEAELAQARLAVVQGVTAAHSKVQQEKYKVAGRRGPTGV
jgi:outer membrane protein TolC